MKQLIGAEINSVDTSNGPSEVHGVFAVPLVLCVFVSFLDAGYIHQATIKLY